MNTTQSSSTVGSALVKRGLADMLRGGVIMDVVNPEQAKIAEDAGAVAVMALERVPSDIRRDGGVARMSDPQMIQEIQAMVTIPVMAKARIGHFAEAQILQALDVDYIDESEVLTPADEVAASSIRYPLGLAGALRKCAERPVPNDSFFASAAYAKCRWIWFDIWSDRPTRDLGDLDDVELRALALEEW